MNGATYEKEKILRPEWDSNLTSGIALLVHNVLLELVSVRTSAMLGGLLMASGMMLGMFAYSLPFLIFCLSVLIGMGNAMTYGPGLVLLGQYFDQRRAMAMSLANTGSSASSHTAFTNNAAHERAGAERRVNSTSAARKIKTRHYRIPKVQLEISLQARDL
nr:hypothetical protein BaRGS_007374 [Batillaria attramentaria]